MNWKNFLAKLRQKPAEQKTAILWTAVISCMSVIFVFWLVSLNYSIKENLSQKENDSSGEMEVASELEKLRKDLPTLWQSLSAGVSEIFNSNDRKMNYETTSSPIPAENDFQEILPVE